MQKTRNAADVEIIKIFWNEFFQSSNRTPTDLFKALTSIHFSGMWFYIVSFSLNAKTDIDGRI